MRVAKLKLRFDLIGAGLVSELATVPGVEINCELWTDRK